MKEIVIKTIPHKKQRYDTAGDYFEKMGSAQIRVSDLESDDFEFLVALHELIEQKLCKKRGIEEHIITAFDKNFEKKRQEGNTDEPGEDLEAPYRKEHFFATTIERLMARELGVDWKAYEERLNLL